MTRTSFAIAVLCFPLISSCIHKEVEYTFTNSSGASPTETSSPRPDNQIIKESGWEIPGLAGSKARERTEVKDHPGLFATRYTPGRGRKSYFSEDERARLMVFRGELSVNSLTGFDINGKKFCYITTVYPPGIGADIILHFYDLDGDGQFEIADSFSSLFPHLYPSSNN
jgi:hypothetical protein